MGSVDPQTGYFQFEMEPERVVLGSAHVPGPPVPKKRARTFVTPSGKVSAYTPKETVEYETNIGKCWVGRRYFEGPVEVRITVHESPQVGSKYHASDLDNYVKSCLDALNKIAWQDDKQVTRIEATIERNHPNPSMTVTVFEA